MGQVDGAGRALGDAGAAALADSRVNKGRTEDTADAGEIGRDAWHAVGTDPHTGQTAHTQLWVHLRDNTADAQGLFCKNGRRARGRRPSLHDGLVKQLGVVGRASHEYPIGGEIHRPQLHVRFLEPSVQIHRHFQLRPQRLRSLRRHHRHAQHQHVRRQCDLLSQDRIPCFHY